MKDIKLSDHFTFNELTGSLTHPDLVEANRILALHYQDVLTELCTTILEPIRLKIDKPVIITSGFRSPDLNTVIGGSKTSQHLAGQAADFIVRGYTIDELYAIVKELDLNIGQCIHEQSWLHVSLGEPYRTKEKCKQYFKILP